MRPKLKPKRCTRNDASLLECKAGCPKASDLLLNPDFEPEGHDCLASGQWANPIGGISLDTTEEMAPGAVFVVRGPCLGIDFSSSCPVL